MIEDKIFIWSFINSEVNYYWIAQNNLIGVSTIVAQGNKNIGECVSIVNSDCLIMLYNPMKIFDIIKHIPKAIDEKFINSFIFTNFA